MLRNRRIIRVVLAVTTLLTLTLCTAGWMVLQHVPAWYQPFWLRKAEIREVRERAEVCFASTTQSMVAGKPFTVRFTARELNELLIARHWLWPGADRWMGPLRTPYMHITTDGMQFGARHHWGNIQSVVSIDLSAEPSPDHLILRIDGVHIGSMHMPLSLATANLDLEAGPDAQDASDLERIFVGLLKDGESVAVTNRFSWPNGNIPFRIDHIDLGRDDVTFGIHPLHVPTR